MKYQSHSVSEERAIDYRSTDRFNSDKYPGVNFEVARMSFGRRTELIRRIREIAAPIECLNSSDQVADQLQAQLLGQQVDNLFLAWGLVSITGLSIDGYEADIDTLLAKGPVDLAAEIVVAVKESCGLSDAERKN